MPVSKVLVVLLSTEQRNFCTLVPSQSHLSSNPLGRGWPIRSPPVAVRRRSTSLLQGAYRVASQAAQIVAVAIGVVYKRELNLAGAFQQSDSCGVCKQAAQRLVFFDGTCQPYCCPSSENETLPTLADGLLLWASLVFSSKAYA